MSGTEMRPGGLCSEVEERLSEVLDGTAPAALYDHLADCDACRDLRHDAAQAAERIAAAGADFRPAEGFVDALVARLEAARPAGGAPPVSGEAASPASPPQAAGPDSGAAAKPAPTEPGLAPDVPDVVVRTQPDADPAALTETPLRESGPVPARAHRSGAVGATSHHAVDTAPGAPSVAPPRPARTLPDTPSAAPAGTPPPASELRRGAVVPLFRRPRFVAAAAVAMAAAASVGFWLKGRPGPEQGPVAVDAPWSGKVAGVKRAAADKAGGLEACDEGGACAPLADGAPLALPATLRTDARTRAYLTLQDGSQLALDRGSRVWIGAGKERQARVEAGMIVADVAKLDGAKPARFTTPQGEVEVLGTKLAITAAEDRASVEVARGSVRVTGERGEPVEVRAGEEATLARGAAPKVASATSLADMMEWSDRSSEEVDAPTLRGLGELRARKPGSTQEKERAVRLAKHAVKVRIVDVVARTEIDETFTNDTDEELEGIFRFPLPPGAQIERLALEVDGKLMEGAFVDRDRGAAIWRGVIQNAAPKAPKPREEIIWVPGPWRDPALLEWQRGGRFELRIFPIPKRGSRRVVLTYTQLVEQSGGVRRYTYPLAHDDSGTTRVGDFSLDLQVLGHDRELGVETRGYDLAPASADGAADRRTLSAQSFTPAGDLTVEYALPDRDREATAWAYRMDTPVKDEELVEAAQKAKSADEKSAIEAAQSLVRDASPYVAIALRPKLPRWQEAKERRHVLVVDASRSMVGERFARAKRLAASIVREMDRRDEFVLLACDTVCRSLDNSDDSSGAARPMAPGAAAAGEVERFLGSIEPDGGSDLAAAMIAARAAAGSAARRELRILYLGDGTPSVGPTRPSHLETAVRAALPGGDAAVVAIALGADADTTSLQALARGGGGVVVPYVPGQRVTSAALDALGAAYGLMLRDPEVDLPPGLTQVTPARLDPIRAGGETFVLARMGAGSDVSGTIRLRGRVGGERFEQSYPVSIAATSNAGNAFVPRLFAAAKIAELERVGSESQKPTIIELSKRFNVASRFTSLLVLESEAMFKAFGLDRGGIAPAFTGEERAESGSADAEGEEPDEAAAGDEGTGQGYSASGRVEAKGKRDLDDDFDVGFGGAPGGLGRARGGPASAPQSAAEAAPAPASPPRPAPRPAATSADPMEPPAKVAPPADEEPSARWRRAPPQRMIPMRRVFDRRASFEAVNALASQNASRLLAAESELSVAPNSRDKTAGLYALYATSGRLGEAQELTSRWSGRDALDPDALTARADLAARLGERDRAVRILGGLADVRPGDKATQTRLADLHDAASAPALACRHRLALADLAPGDAKLVSTAVQCARTQGMNELADQIRVDLDGKVREQVDKLLATPATAPSVINLRGDVQLIAEWTGATDVDIALIDEQGRRISWMGTGAPASKVTISAQDATSARREAIGLVNLPKGQYVVEISRAAGGSAASDVVRGDLTLKLVNETRKIPFTLTGPRVELGTVKVFFTSRLVPVDSRGGWGIDGGWGRGF